MWMHIDHLQDSLNSPVTVKTVQWATANKPNEKKEPTVIKFLPSVTNNFQTELQITFPFLLLNGLQLGKRARCKFFGCRNL